MLGCMTLSGLFVPLITPFTPAGEVDIARLGSQAAAVLDDGADGIVALGTTGEPATLSAPESRRVVDVCATACGERDRPLIVGAGSNSTSASSALLADLDPRATAALVVVPYYTRPSQEGVVEHFRHLASVSPVPVVIYNVPYRTGLTLTVDTLRRLADLPNVVGFKHSVGSIDEATIEFMGDLDPTVSVLAGDDVFAGPLAALGARGAVMASANVATRAYADLLASWGRGPTELARARHDRLAPLTRALFAEPNPSVIKAVLAARGRISSALVRPPLLPATDAAVAVALDALACLEAS